MMISLILPVYNCFSETEHFLPELTNRLLHQGSSFEIILVDDHSRDPKQFRKLAAANHCIYLRNEKNSGKGFSVRKGISHARGSILIFMDGDFPFDLDVIDRMYKALQNEKSEIVIGDRTLEQSVFPAETARIRKWGSNILSYFAKRLITPGFSDTQCGIKGFRKSVAENIFPYLVVDGFSFDMELLFVAIRKKYTISKIPVRTRKQQTSSVRVLYHGVEMLFNIGRIYLRKWRGLYRI